MKTVFEAFPEIVFADATYKLLDSRIPVFVLLVEDGNGQSEIASIGLLVNELHETLKWFFQTFQKNNPASINTNVFMTDKDMNERKVINDIFPDAKLLICLFHALRTFHREITCDKLGITPQERDQSKVLFEKLCYSDNEEEYQKLYDTLRSFAPSQVMDYFLWKLNYYFLDFR
ncbi:unnamed protein product [Macrosiphum euphorbiae]|nr:unnamed protein product [Macrosiphum euphorbiae]